jgi:hypothetical protein
MKTELIDNILDGYAEIIRDLLDSPDRLRFERITRIAKLAHALHQQTAMRVGEMAIDYEAGVVHYAEDGANYVLGGGDHTTNQADVIREVVGAFHPVIRLYMEREQETRLRKLFDLRALMEEADQDISVIDERIAKLTADLQKENSHAHSGVVHPELLRGHPSGADGPGELQGDRRESERPGNGSAGPAAEDSYEEGLACCDGEAGLDGHDDGGSTHRQGCRRHCTFPETGA